MKPLIITGQEALLILSLHTAKQSFLDATTVSHLRGIVKAFSEAHTDPVTIQLRYEELRGLESALPLFGEGNPALLDPLRIRLSTLIYEQEQDDLIEELGFKVLGVEITYARSTS